MNKSFLVNDLVKNKKHNVPSTEDKLKKLQAENRKLKRALKILEEKQNSDSALMFLAEMSNDGVMVIQNKKILYMNSGFLKLMGYSKKEVIGKSYEKFIPEPEWKRLEESTKKRLNGENVSPIYEIKVFKKSGALVDVGINVTVTDYKKKPALVIALRELSDLKQYQKINREQSEFLNTILDASPIPLFYKDPEGKYQGCNSAFCSFTGASKEELIGSRIKNVFRDKFAQINSQVDSELISSGGKKVYETTFTQIDGRVLDIIVHKQAYYGSDKKIAGVIGAIVDISEKNKIQKELEAERKYLESIIQNLPLLIFMIDKTGVVKLVEGKVLDSLNMKSEDIVNKHYKEISGENLPIIKSIEQGLNGISNSSYNIYNNFHLESYYVPLFDNKDNVEGVIGVSLDVTKRRIAEQEIQKYLLEVEENRIKLEENARELEESEKSLIEMNNQKDKFFSIISHDLRSPFNSILGLSDYVINEYDSMNKEEIREVLYSFNRNAHNIFALLENLLTWSKIQMGRSEIELTNVNLRDVALSIINIFKLNLQNKNIRVEVDIEEKTEVFADRNMIDTAVRNIISNSIKFTPDEGKITLSAFCDIDFCTLKISDSGIGMDETKLTNLFSLEAMKSSPGLKGERGTGLGLILTKDLIEANGGTISVESKENIGTTFSIRLPVFKIS